MSNGSARIFVGNQPAGTAWRFHDRYALTAAHCIGEDDQPLPVPAEVRVLFPGIQPLRARTRVKDGLDAALLEFIDPVPAGIPTIELTRPPPEPMLSSYEWRGIAYPLVNELRQMIVSGFIRGHVTVPGGSDLQISFNDVVNHRVNGRETLLSYASGAAVTYQARAIGIVRASLAGTQIGHAVPIDRVASAFSEVRQQLRDYPVASGVRWREIDRRAQWTEVVTASTEADSKVFLLPGEAGQCHKTFLERLESHLAAAPRVRFLDVRWPDVWTTPDFVAALSSALDDIDDPDEQRLARRLREVTTHTKLVVVHDLLDASKYADELDTVQAYYREVLPRIVGDPVDATARGSLWIQPFEWTDERGRAAAHDLMARLIAPRQLSPGIDEQLAPRPRGLSVEQLPELTLLTATDLQTFGAPPSVMKEWARHPTTRQAYRLLKDAETGRSHGP